MIGPDFSLFSKLIEIVFLAILLVIFVKWFWSRGFSFAPVGSLCTPLLETLKGGIILAPLVDA